jgi:hypothetical protein
MTSTQLLVRAVLMGGLLLGAPALAQDAGQDAGGVEDFDGGLPDASVGGSSADNDTENQGEGRHVIDCKLTSDCDRGFACQSGKCIWVGYKDAKVGGCSGAPAFVGLGLGGLALRVRRNRRR